MTANPTIVAAHTNMRRIRTREAEIIAADNADRNRRREARKRGYRGPFTRAELAARVGA